MITKKKLQQCVETSSNELSLAKKSLEANRKDRVLAIRIKKQIIVLKTRIEAYNMLLEVYD